MVTVAQSTSPARGMQAIDVAIELRNLAARVKAAGAIASLDEQQFTQRILDALHPAYIRVLRLEQVGAKKRPAAKCHEAAAVSTTKAANKKRLRRAR